MLGKVPSGNLISCDGATNSIHFGSFGGSWDIELDGTRYATNGDNVAYYIRNHFSNILEAHDDGWMGVINIDSVAHRIKLIPLNAPEQPNSFTPPTNNPTFMEHEDGSLTFCLGVVGIPIGCEGATNTCITIGFERVWQLVVNDQVLSSDVWGMGGESALISLLADVGIAYIGSYGRVEYVNTTNEYKSVRFNAGVPIGPHAQNTNPTLHTMDNGWTAFCLAPNNEEF